MATKSPTKQDSGRQQTGGKLLSPEAQAACGRIAAGEAPWSQRAQALLAVDEGATQAQAGESAGLTQGQVKYWVGQFRSDQLSIFPEAELSVGTGGKQKKKAKAKKKTKRKPKAAKKTKKGKKPQKKKKKRAGGRSGKRSKKKRKS
jgi:hypothetical protein